MASGDIEVRKVNGKENLADILTKHASAEDITVHMYHLRNSYAQGRHAIMPHIAVDG